MKPRLTEFVRDLVDKWAWSADVDGGDFQDSAVRHGVLVPTEMAEPCDQGRCGCAENGADFPTTCYRLHAELLDPDPQPTTIRTPRAGAPGLLRLATVLDDAVLQCPEPDGHTRVGAGDLRFHDLVELREALERLELLEARVRGALMLLMARGPKSLDQAERILGDLVPERESMREGMAAAATAAGFPFPGPA